MDNMTEFPPAEPPNPFDELPMYYPVGRHAKGLAVWRGADGQWRGFRGKRVTAPYNSRNEALAAITPRWLRGEEIRRPGRNPRAAITRSRTRQ